MNDSSSNKLILITGGTRGLGKAIAKQLAKVGCSVIVTSRTAAFNNNHSIEAGTELVQQLDVTKEKSIERLFNWLKLLNRKLDVLVNNAGVGIFKPMEELQIQDWHAVIETDLTGAFLCAREAYKLMQKSGGGRIIHIGSTAGSVPLKENIAYGVAKWGLKGLSTNLNEEGREYRIQSTYVTLGATATDIWKSRLEFSKDDMLDPDEVAKCLLHIILLPLTIAVSEIEILPEKGIL